MRNNNMGYVWNRRVAIAAGLALFICAPLFTFAANAGTHWSKQFPIPKKSTAMNAATGMSGGTGKPSFRRVKWHDGKLWMAGRWEAGVDAKNLTKSIRNQPWHLWTWSPTAGYEVVAYFHKTQGGRGPAGVINDFIFLPDGRMVVAGEFTRVDNEGGNLYHEVNALAVYDPKEPSADKWRPLGKFQYNGTVSSGGSLKSIAYDPQGNDLYIGGSFQGITLQKPERSYAVHRYDFDTKSYEPMQPGLFGSKQTVYRLHVDTSTRPSTVYVGGKFHYTAGNGLDPSLTTSTAKYSTSFASFQLGKGWTAFPADFPTEGSAGKAAGILSRAADYMAFDAAIVRDFLVDGKDIWVCGSFSQGRDQQPLRGIAKWDRKRSAWVDPTGKGGVGRDCFSMAKADNGKIYFSGAFGGRKGKDAFYPGLLDGTSAYGVLSFDPASGQWDALEPGLSTLAMPEVRLAANGNDIYFVGDFNHIDPKHFGRKAPKESESSYIARWNETIDFSANPAKTGGSNAPYAPDIATKVAFSGNEHWSRAFFKPDRNTKKKVSGMNTGSGSPNIAGIVWLGDTLYFGGNWEVKPGQRWYVWSFHPEQGWKKVAWAKGEGIDSPPEGVKVHDGKLYAYGAIKNFSGIGIYDPQTKAWSKLQGTYAGKPVTGNTALHGTGVINDVAWDPGNGDMYIVGNWAPNIENPAYKAPKDVAAAFRIGKDGVYHSLGHDLKAENPGKPIKGIYSIALDASKSPVDVYVGGTFNFYGPVPTTHKRMAYNVAKWDYEAKDWRPIGKGIRVGLSPLDKEWYPDGLPGLPTKTNEPGYENYQGFIVEGFPRIRDLVVDEAGNLYAGGTLGIVQRKLPVHERSETYGIAKYDKAKDAWVSFTEAGGVSRDVNQITILDDGRLLISGSFCYDNDWNQLHNVAIIDPRSGKIQPLGGGLQLALRGQVIGAEVVHTVRNNELWFAGYFDHAGVNANSTLEAPVESNYVAMYDLKRNLDPNHGLAVSPVEPIQAPSGNSSASVNIKLSATLADGTGAITWYEKQRNGKFKRKGTGVAYTAKARVKKGDGDLFYYVTVTREDGVEGGKMPVRIPVR